MEDVLGNLNLSSNLTPQMTNLGLSQERESAYWHTGELHDGGAALFPFFFLASSRRSRAY